MRADTGREDPFLPAACIGGAASPKGCLLNSFLSLYELFFQEVILHVNQPELFSVVWHELFPSSPLFYFSLVHSPLLLVLCLSIYFWAVLSLSLFIDVHIQEFSLSPPFLPLSGSASFLSIIKLFLNCSLLGLAHAQSTPHGPCFPGWWAVGLQ